MPNFKYYERDYNEWDYYIIKRQKGETVWYEAVRAMTGDVHCAHWFKSFCIQWVIDNFGAEHIVENN